jgi:hypothetical protein
MAYISKKDSNGVKGPLAEGELGLDITGSDDGRIGVGTVSGNVLLAKKDEVDTLDTRVSDVEGRTDASEVAKDELKAVTGTTVDTRYDKLLAVRDVIDMEYVDGDLSTVRYEGDDDATVYYRDVMTYDVDGNLVEVKHYHNTADLITASGQTVLTYSAGDLATATYSE